VASSVTSRSLRHRGWHAGIWCRRHRRKAHLLWRTQSSRLLAINTSSYSNIGNESAPIHSLASTPPGMPGTPPIFWLGDVNGNIPPILLRTFGYSRPILVVFRSLSLKPFSFGYKTPPFRFSPLSHPPHSVVRLPQTWTRVDVTGYIWHRECRLLGLAIFNAEILIYFSNKIHGSNFVKQQSETVMVWNYQNADCSLKKILLCHLL